MKQQPSQPTNEKGKDRHTKIKIQKLLFRVDYVALII